MKYLFVVLLVFTMSVQTAFAGFDYVGSWGYPLHNNIKTHIYYDDFLGQVKIALLWGPRQVHIADIIVEGNNVNNRFVITEVVDTNFIYTPGVTANFVSFINNHIVNAQINLLSYSLHWTNECFVLEAEQGVCVGGSAQEHEEISFMLDVIGQTHQLHVPNSTGGAASMPPRDVTLDDDRLNGAEYIDKVRSDFLNHKHKKDPNF